MQGRWKISQNFSCCCNRTGEQTEELYSVTPVTEAVFQWLVCKLLLTTFVLVSYNSSKRITGLAWFLHGRYWCKAWLTLHSFFLAIDFRHVIHIQHISCQQSWCHNNEKLGIVSWLQDGEICRPLDIVCSPDYHDLSSWIHQGHNGSCSWWELEFRAVTQNWNLRLKFKIEFHAVDEDWRGRWFCWEDSKSKWRSAR